MSLVSFVHVPHDDYEALRESIRKSLELINFGFDKKVRKIVIKPNMCYYFHPSTGETTDPYFVGVLIDVLREHFVEASEIFVAESDASAMKCKYAFRMLGYDRLAGNKSVNLVNLSEGKSKAVDIEVNNAKFTFYVPELFYEADLVVNVPKPKYMSDVKITCALKNMFGCNAYPKKYIYHRALSEAIVGINKLIKTDLVVLDGLFVSSKYTKKLSMVMSSVDPVALDAAAAKIMGIEPKSVKQIVLASKEGLGSLNFSAVGDYNYAMKEFPRKSFKDNVRETIASFYLHVMHEE